MKSNKKKKVLVVPEDEPERDQLAVSLRNGFESIIKEADEWRPIAQHVLNLMERRNLILDDEIIRLRSELASATFWNKSVAVCAGHTGDIVSQEGCVICDLVAKDKVIEVALAYLRRPTFAMRDALAAAIRTLDGNHEQE